MTEMLLVMTYALLLGFLFAKYLSAAHPTSRAHADCVCLFDGTKMQHMGRRAGMVCGECGQTVAYADIEMSQTVARLD